METQVQTVTPKPWLASRAQFFIFAICLAAGFKVFVFSMALPFFPLDEELHFDAIYKFAAGYKSQRDLPGFDVPAAELIELYHSPEFLKQPLPGQPFMPLPWWCAPNKEHLPSELAYRVNAWLELRNVEINAPPVYYLIQAAWYKLGRTLGYSGISILYWLRSLNAIAYGIFVAVAWLFVKECYPENLYLQTAVPVFLAAFPQDALLFIIPNSLSPVFMALVLLLSVKLLRQPERSIGMYMVTGLVAAATALLGFGNFVVGVPLAVVAFVICKDDAQSARKILAMLAVAGVPVALWLIRNRLVLGDWSGSKTKQQYLGWSVQPVSQMLRHPLFSASGAGYFLSSLSRNFWRGEMFWHGTPRTAWVHPVYLWISVLLCGTFAVTIMACKKRAWNLERFADVSSLAMVVGSVVFLMAISLPFDFGHCFYPSRARPYFVSGRIIIGVLLPFAIMFLRGLQVLCARISPRTNPLIVAVGITAGVLVTETILFFPIFASRFNFWSLLLGRICG